jgi:phage shock protein C
MAISLLVVLGVFALLMLTLLAGLIALLVALTRRSRSVEEQHSARITRELEKIAALQASGRISAAEGAELRQALEDQSLGGEPPGGRSRLRKTAPAVLAGVCGGLAEWMNWDPTLVRVGYVLATLLIAGFPGIIIYIVLAVVMPQAVDAAPARPGRTLLILMLLLAAPFLLAAATVGYLLLARAA